MKHFFPILLSVWLLTPGSLSAAEELDVLAPAADGVAPGMQLELWLKNEFYKLVGRRRGHDRRPRGDHFQQMIQPRLPLAARLLGDRR